MCIRDRSRARLFTQLFLTDSTVSAHRHPARPRAFADVIGVSPFAPESLPRDAGGVSDTMTRVGHRLTQRVFRERTNERMNDALPNDDDDDASTSRATRR